MNIDKTIRQYILEIVEGKFSQAYADIYDPEIASQAIDAIYRCVKEAIGVIHDPRTPLNTLSNIDFFEMNAKIATLMERYNTIATDLILVTITKNTDN